MPEMRHKSPGRFRSRARFGVGVVIDLDPRRGWRATRSFVTVVVVDVGFPPAVDSDNDIDNDYDGDSRLPSTAAALSDAPTCGGIDRDNDYDYDIGLAGRLAHGLVSLPSEICGARTGQARRGTE